MGGFTGNRARARLGAAGVGRAVCRANGPAGSGRAAPAARPTTAGRSGGRRRARRRAQRNSAVQAGAVPAAPLFQPQSLGPLLAVSPGWPLGNRRARFGLPATQAAGLARAARAGRAHRQLLRRLRITRLFHLPFAGSFRCFRFYRSRPFTIVTHSRPLAGMFGYSGSDNPGRRPRSGHAWAGASSVIRQIRSGRYMRAFSSPLFAFPPPPPPDMASNRGAIIISSFN